MFDDEAVETAAILASFASVALAGARHAERADQLEVGMATNREIGAAVGILMATHNITQERGLRPAEQRLAAAQPQAARHRHRIVRGDQGTGA